MLTQKTLWTQNTQQHSLSHNAQYTLWTHTSQHTLWIQNTQHTLKTHNTQPTLRTHNTLGRAEPAHSTMIQEVSYVKCARHWHQVSGSAQCAPWWYMNRGPKTHVHHVGI
jgi:hypothetical protein